MSIAAENRDFFTDHIRQHRVIAILRHVPPEQAGPVFDALYAGGIRLIEITMNSAGAARQIRQQQERMGGRMLIGAGTVTSRERAEAALAAGARFLVTPNLNLEVLQIAAENQAPVIPGVMTPTEMVQAVQAGAQVLKLFPASQLGLDYMRAVMAPLDDLNLVAVGGISTDNAAAWLKAGCLGVGLGSSLFDSEQARLGQYDQIAAGISSFLEKLAEEAKAR